MKKVIQLHKKGDTVLVERGGKLVTTTIIRVDYDQKLNWYYYYTRVFGPNMGLPKHDIY